MVDICVGGNETVISIATRNF